NHTYHQRCQAELEAQSVGQDKIAVKYGQIWTRLIGIASAEVDDDQRIKPSIYSCRRTKILSELGTNQRQYRHGSALYLGECFPWKSRLGVPHIQYRAPSAPSKFVLSYLTANTSGLVFCNQP